MPRSDNVAGRRAVIARLAAAASIFIGYADLVRGGTVVAPLALVISYVALVPAALLTD